MSQAAAITAGHSMGIKTRLVSGVFWTTVMAAASQGGSLLGSIASARLLGREDYGKLAMLLSLVGTLTTFASMAWA